VSYSAHREGQIFYPLSVHLAETAAGAAERLSTHPRRQQLVPAALLAGLAHDFGKYTRFFQHYLRTGYGGPEKQHAFLSALWVAHLAEKFKFPPTSTLALFVAICMHHRSLVDPEELLLPPRDLNAPWDYLDPTKSERLEIAKRQIEALHKEGEPEAIALSLKSATQHVIHLLEQKGIPAPAWLESNWTELIQSFFESWIQSYGRLHRHRRRQIRSKDGTEIQNYFDLLTLFSALIDTDKIHAARLKDTERASLPPQPVHTFREKQFGPPHKPVDRLRDELYRIVCSTVSKAPLSQKLFTITAPTGSGKTLAGLAAAFSLRNRPLEPGTPPPRIIYALPFTSIIDQTFDTLQKVMIAGNGPDGTTPVPSSWLLKHHHLAETVFHRQDKNDEESFSLDQALLLIESWQSEIIITTFVQLLHTLIGHKNRMLKKFHRLQNAILILDEVQNIPVEYWPLVERTLQESCNHLNTRVLLMTATRPEWFNKSEVLELAGSERQIRQRFAALDRVTITANPDPFTVEELVEKFTDQYHSNQSYLVILNTIKSSISFYQLLKEKMSSKSPLCYLSTNITPLERTCRLKLLRQWLDSGEKPVLVSTQVVEAGVDLDFDEVWRDLGPVDAVVQAAGRCNRHFTQDNAHVRVWHLVNRTDKGETTLAQYVYGKIHTYAAKIMFETKPMLRESNFYDAIADYFKTVRYSESVELSEKLLYAMQQWHFSPRERGSEMLGVANFALIENRPHYVNVFVELNENAREIWQNYQDTVANEKDYWKRRQAYLSLKHDFSSYILSVPIRLVLGKLDESTTPLRIPREMLNEFYDPDTGFKRIDDEKFVIY
jgi:CRISPR-associated endonuclease/helicase Cas3